MPGVIRVRQDTVYFGSQVWRPLAEQVRKVAVKNGLTLRQVIEEALTIWLLQKSGEEGAGAPEATTAPATDGGGSP
jgi:hypothetical protein